MVFFVFFFFSCQRPSSSLPDTPSPFSFGVFSPPESHEQTRVERRSPLLLRPRSCRFLPPSPPLAFPFGTYGIGFSDPFRQQENFSFYFCAMICFFSSSPSSLVPYPYPPPRSPTEIFAALFYAITPDWVFFFPWLIGGSLLFVFPSRGWVLS